MAEQEYAVVDGQEFHKLAQNEEDTSHTILRKQLTPDKVEKQVDPDNPRIKRFVISTSSPDRDNDTIDAEGWNLESFKQNPVILFSHSPQDPIGRANSIFMEEGKLKADIEFMPKEMSELADSIYQMVENDFLKATSVGFNPSKFEINEERGGLDFKEQELMETSIVSVPANPEALIEAKSKGIDVNPYSQWLESALDQWLEHKDLIALPRKDVEKFYYASKGEDPAKVTSRHRLKLDNLQGGSNMDPEQNKSQEDVTPEDNEAGDAGSASENKSKPVEDKKMTISFSRAHSGGTPKASKDRAWDGPGEVASADVNDLMVMCTWVAELSDDEEEHDKEDFKLPHHIAENNHPVVWRGVVAAMASLMGARGGVDVPEEDRKGIYNHLAKHYREFDEEPPSFEAAEENILAKDGWTMDYETGHPVTIAGGEVKYYQPSEPDEYQELKSEVKSLRKEVAAMTEALNKALETSEDEEGEEKETESTEDNSSEDTEEKSTEVEEPSEEEILNAVKELSESGELTQEIDGRVKSALGLQ